MWGCAPAADGGGGEQQWGGAGNSAVGGCGAIVGEGVNSGGVFNRHSHHK